MCCRLLNFPVIKKVKSLLQASKKGSRKVVPKDRHFEHFWRDYELIYHVCRLSVDNPHWKMGDILETTHKEYKMGLSKNASWFGHTLKKFLYNILDNRLYLREKDDSLGRECVSESELCEVMMRNHEINHDGPRKMYEYLKEIYYPCNHKKFQDMFQQHVVPSCGKCQSGSAGQNESSGLTETNVASSSLLTSI